MSSHSASFTHPSEDFHALLKTWQHRIEKQLEITIPASNNQPSTLHQAMRYSSLDGGKRIRPVLCYATGLATQQPLDQLDAIACAIELIHVYSLIHDDLPCMDDDDLRRGKPTCHIKFDEAMAVLAGDALQALAFKVLSSDPNMNCSDAARLSIINLLSEAAGSQGMAGGQAIDLLSTGQTLDLSELENMHAHKTGALINASVMMAAKNAPILEPSQYQALENYSRLIGLAFQVQDDILDVISDTETLGKQAGADNALNKATFPGILGLEASREKLNTLHNEAIKALGQFGSEADVLRQIANYIVSRAY